MDATFTWEIKAKNSPLLIKKCSHCDSDRFYCSDKFRMNAQKKNIDVWLIYRCVKCDHTCNITLLSRTKPDLIDKTLFHSFSMNDWKAAWKYAFSTEVAWHFSKEDIAHVSDETIKIQVRCEFEFNLKLSSLLKRNFLLSSTRLKRLFEQGAISLLSGKVPQKYKVKDGDIILIDKEYLLGMMDFVDSFIAK